MKTRTNRKIGRFLLLAMMLAVLLAFQCDSDSSALLEAQQHASELARQLAAERSRFQLESTRWDTRLSASESDYTGAVLLWGGTALGFALLVILLARERRARRVLERLLRLILDRFRGPPHP